MKISNYMEKSIKTYGKNTPDIVVCYGRKNKFYEVFFEVFLLIFLAKLGFEEPWCKEFCGKLWQHYKTNVFKREIFYRPIDVLWSILVLKLIEKDEVNCDIFIF